MNDFQPEQLGYGKERESNLWQWYGDFATAPTLLVLIKSEFLYFFFYWKFEKKKKKRMVLTNFTFKALLNCVLCVWRNLLNSSIGNVRGSHHHRGYGKADLPKVTTSLVLAGTRSVPPVKLDYQKTERDLNYLAKIPLIQSFL